MFQLFGGRLEEPQEERMMFRYLLIPDDPWMTWNSSDGGFYSAASEGARVEKFGEYGGWRKLSVAGQQNEYLMWKTVDTGGKWIHRVSGAMLRLLPSLPVPSVRADSGIFPS